MTAMESAMTPAAAFEEAVRLAGGQTPAAALLGKRQPAISKRLKKRQPAKPEEVLPLEAATGISKHVLRPDLYPREIVQARAGTDDSEIAR